MKTIIAGSRDLINPVFDIADAVRGSGDDGRVDEKETGMKTALLVVMMCVASAAQVKPMPTISDTAPTEASPVKGKDCTTEPGGGKILDGARFYPEGISHVFKSWIFICRYGRWHDDNAAMKLLDDSMRDLRGLDAQQAELLTAAKTRILNTKELQKLMQYGSLIFARDGEGFRQEEIDRKFAAILQFQMLLRMDSKARGSAPPQAEK